MISCAVYGVSVFFFLIVLNIFLFASQCYSADVQATFAETNFDNNGEPKRMLAPADVPPVVGMSEECFLEANIDMAKSLKKLSDHSEEVWLFVTCWCVGDRPGNISVLQEAAECVGMRLRVMDCRLWRVEPGKKYLDPKFARAIEGERKNCGFHKKTNIVFWANSAENDQCFGRFFYQLFCGSAQLAESTGQVVDPGLYHNIFVHYAFTFTKGRDEQDLRARLAGHLVDMDHYGIPENERFDQWKLAVEQRLLNVHIKNDLGKRCVSFPNDVALVNNPSVRSLACKLLGINPQGCPLSMADLLQRRPFKNVEVVLCALDAQGVQGFSQCLQCERLFHALADLDPQGVGCLWFDGHYVKDLYQYQQIPQGVMTEKRLIVPSALLDDEQTLILPGLADYAQCYKVIVGFDPL